MQVIILNLQKESGGVVLSSDNSSINIFLRNKFLNNKAEGN